MKTFNMPYGVWEGCIEVMKAVEFLRKHVPLFEECPGIAVPRRITIKHPPLSELEKKSWWEDLDEEMTTIRAELWVPGLYVTFYTQGIYCDRYGVTFWKIEEIKLRFKYEFWGGEGRLSPENKKDITIILKDETLMWLSLAWNGHRDPFQPEVQSAYNAVLEPICRAKTQVECIREAYIAGREGTPFCWLNESDGTGQKWERTRFANWDPITESPANHNAGPIVS